MSTTSQAAPFTREGLFPDAPAGWREHELERLDMFALAKQRAASPRGRRFVLTLVAGAALFAGTWAGVLPTVIGALGGLYVMVGGGIAMSLAQRDARLVTYRRWAEARGLVLEPYEATAAEQLLDTLNEVGIRLVKRVSGERRDLGMSVPLLRRGKARGIPHVMRGRIAPDVEAAVATFLYREKDDGRDDTIEDFGHTLVCVRLPDAVAARYAGVYAVPTDHTLVYQVDASGTVGEAVTFESVELAKVLRVSCAAGQERVALYELFSTPFMVALTEQARIAEESGKGWTYEKVATPWWHQEGAGLVVIGKGFLEKADDLDALCACAVGIARRYMQEHM